MPRQIRISSSALIKPATTAGFDVLQYCGDNMGTKKNILYRPPKIVITGKKWYIELYYRIPEKYRAHYNNRRWERFKIYKDINVMRTPEYNAWLLSVLGRALESGWSPFKEEEVLTEEIKQKEWTIQQAALYFLQKWEGRGLSQASDAKYKRCVNRFLSWLQSKGLQHESATSINSSHLENYLEQIKASEQWTNSTYNGERGFLSTMFNFLLKKEIIKKKPEAGSKLKAISKKHRYYDDRTYNNLNKIMTDHDPYLAFAFQIVYYLCIRSEEELKHLQIKYLYPERKQAFLTNGKTGERYIPLVNEAVKLFEERKIFDCDPEYYVLSVGSKTKFIRDGQPGPEPFGKGFFSKRFAKIRKLAGLSSVFTLYGAKHTRVIHLKMDGAKDADIMSLTGHTSFEAYSKYLRDLGLTADTEALNLKTRKL